MLPGLYKVNETKVSLMKLALKLRWNVGRKKSQLYRTASANSGTDSIRGHI